LLERIESRFGKCTAFDGRIAAWFGATCWDLRDIARLMKEDVGEVCDCMPVFEAPKRGRRSAAIRDGVQDAESGERTEEKP
jgi:hypothetical protein